jgi:hypothetical protein
MSKLPAAKPKAVAKKPPAVKPKQAVKKPKQAVKKPPAVKPKAVAKILTTAKPRPVAKKPPAVKPKQAVKKPPAAKPRPVAKKAIKQYGFGLTEDKLLKEEDKKIISSFISYKKKLFGYSGNEENKYKDKIKDYISDVLTLTGLINGKLKELNVKQKIILSLNFDKPDSNGLISDFNYLFTYDKIVNGMKILLQSINVKLNGIEIQKDDASEQNVKKSGIHRAVLKPLPPVLSDLKPSGSVCSQILTPMQSANDSTCWFMANIVSMFYSQRSRKILMDALNNWHIKEELFTLFESLLKDRYLKTMNSNDNEKSRDDFIKILNNLYIYDPKSFPYDIGKHSGFMPEYYIGKLYGLFDIDYKVFHYNKNTEFLFYSFLNMEIDNVEYETDKDKKKINVFYRDNDFNYYNNKVMETPKILIVVVRYMDDKMFKQIYPNTIIKDDDDTKKAITSMEEIIKYRGVDYHLDSVILQNWNYVELGHKGHAIVGLTCNEKKYVYNGWKKKDGNGACELMQHDWEIKGDAEGGDVCINNNNCSMDKIDTKDKIFQHNKFCFNFRKGKRILIYVRDDDNPSNTSKKQSQKP